MESTLTRLLKDLFDVLSEEELLRILYRLSRVGLSNSDLARTIEAELAKRGS